MKMVEVKTAELIGSALDWAVAKSMGWQLVRVPTDIDGNHGGEVLAPPDFSHEFKFPQRGRVPPGFFVLRWSSDWSQGGPLIDRYRVSIIYSDEQCDPCAWTDSTNAWHGETPLIAACRAIVAAKLGDVVSVPAELVNGGGV